MGMDSYIYTSSKDSEVKYKEYLRLLKVRDEKMNSYVGKLIEKYPALKDNLGRENFEKIASKEDVEAFDKAWDEVNVKEPEDKNEEEIMYWRKAWGLHWYINEYLGDHDNDNCVRVYLTKEFVNRLIKDLERYVTMSILDFENDKVDHDKPNYYRDNPFGKDDYWDYMQMYDTYKFFKQLIADWDDNLSYYYYSWY